MKQITRRSFLKHTLAAAATVTIAGTKSSGRVLGANDVIRVGVAGIHGQGKGHIDQYLGLKGVQITYLIDPDASLFASRSAPIKEKWGQVPEETLHGSSWMPRRWFDQLENQPGVGRDYLINVARRLAKLD